MAIKIIQRLQCEDCRKPIEPGFGIIIQGNIYMVGNDVAERGGIVGPNFPIERDPDAKFSLAEIGESAYHWICIRDYIADMFREIANDWEG